MKQLICIFVICSLSGATNAAQELKKGASDQGGKDSSKLIQKAELQPEKKCSSDFDVDSSPCRPIVNKTDERFWNWMPGKNAEARTQGGQ